MDPATLDPLIIKNRLKTENCLRKIAAWGKYYPKQQNASQTRPTPAVSFVRMRRAGKHPKKPSQEDTNDAILHKGPPHPLQAARQLFRGLHRGRIPGQPRQLRPDAKHHRGPHRERADEHHRSHPEHGQGPGPPSPSGTGSGALRRKTWRSSPTSTRNTGQGA